MFFVLEDFHIMKFVVCLLPVIVFLLSLFLFDSFKLVGKMTLILCILWGGVAAVLSYYMNTFLLEQSEISFEKFARLLAPFTEEISKALVIIFLVYKKKIGFPVDAAIYGFAAGAGFALAENIYYLLLLGEGNHFTLWILRGFGTALMHGGNTAIFGILLISGVQREKPFYLAICPGLLLVFIMHSIFNHFFLHPALQTIFILIILPGVFVLMFRRNNMQLQNWLEIEFSNEVNMLSMIRKGNFLQTRSGKYLASLKDHFAPEMIVDLYCYISLYLELSIKAKRNMMLKENGFKAIIEPDIGEKLLELKNLRRQIGKVGEMAMWPIVRINYREIWKLNLLKK